MPFGMRKRDSMNVTMVRVNKGQMVNFSLELTRSLRSFRLKFTAS